MPGVGRAELFWDCLHLESSWFLVPEKHPHVGNSSELFTVGVFLHLLQLFLLLGWKKNLLVISHNLWGSAFDSPTEKKETKRLREGPMGRCCWEGNVVHSIDLLGWGMVRSPLSAKGQLLPGLWLFYSNLSSQINWREQARACIRRKPRGSGPGQADWKERRGKQVPSTKDVCPVGPFRPQSPLTTQRAPFQGESISLDNSIPLWTALWSLAGFITCLGFWKSQGVSGPPAFFARRLRLGWGWALSTETRTKGDCLSWRTGAWKSYLDPILKSKDCETWWGRGNKGNLGNIPWCRSFKRGFKATKGKSINIISNNTAGRFNVRGMQNCP